MEEKVNGFESFLNQINIEFLLKKFQILKINLCKFKAF